MSKLVPKKGAEKEKGGNGSAKRNACKQGGCTNMPGKSKASRACKESEGESETERKRKRERKKEKEKERLSALGSQDTLVTARQVSPGIDASAILTKHQREA